MMVVRETAKIYKGGGRRFFTQKAAYIHAARAKIRSRCDCEPPEYADFETGYIPCPCKYHEDMDKLDRLKNRLARWYKYLDAKKDGEVLV